MTEDEQLLAELDEALRSAQRVPAGFVAAGKSAFAWRNVDAELAALTDDSATGAALAGTRAEQAALRALTFAASDISIEVEVTADALLGQIVPPQPGQVELRNRDGSGHTVPIDEVGWFAIRPVPTAMFRLHLRTADGSTVITEWVTL